MSQICKVEFILLAEVSLLSLLVSFLTPRKQNTEFLMFLSGIEREQWYEIGQTCINEWFYYSSFDNASLPHSSS